DTAAIGAINAVANLGELAEVNHGLYTVSNQMTDAVANHLSIIDNEEAGRDVWAAYIHNKEDMDGMKLGGIEAKYDAKYNGVVVGMDLIKSDKGTAGVALTYVDGDVSGTSSGVHTKNDAKYYGASLYGRIGNSNMALLGDISYMHSKGDITQYNSGVDITAKPKSDAFSVGVRAEWKVKIGENAKLMPFAGLRYMRMGTGNYENSLGMEYDVNNQNIFMAPVGLTYCGNFDMGDKGWKFKPLVEVGYTFNMGDKDTDQKVSYNGYGDTFGMDIVDSGYWFGRVGFGFCSERTEWILGYQYMKSENTRNNKYMVHFNYKF
ncbi:MAG: autotransporter outer membrane beta-barrel domain-containing protein, partial [Acidaminococcaceae bacterium]|nr:autotransporter outer membrane beta-barrel domain-containing protein [Acidaminococcaceae bacterium]